MFLKLHAIIAIEVVIILLSFLIAEDKTLIGEIAAIYCFITIISALTYFIVISIKRKLIHR